MADDYTKLDYFGLRDPDDGAREWYRTIEWDIQELDDALVKRGSLANRPDFGTAGRLYLAEVNGTHILYKDTGNGWVVTGGTDLDGHDLTDGQGSVVVWDTTNSEVPQAQLGGPAASLTNYPLPNSDLSNSTVTVAGNAVGLGGSTAVAGKDLSDAASIAYLNEAESVTGTWTFEAGPTLDATSAGLVDGGTIASPPATLTGYYDSDGTTSVTATAVDAALQHVVNADGSSALEIAVQATTALRALSSGTVEVLGDVTDGTNTIWDSTNAVVPQARLGGPAASLTSYPIPNSDLSNSTVTIAGNSVGLGGSTGVALGDLSNVTATGEGSGGGLDSDKVDGYDVYVKSSAPNTNDPYIRFEP